MLKNPKNNIIHILKTSKYNGYNFKIYKKSDFKYK